MAKAAEGFLPFFEDISFEIPQLRQDPTLCLRCRSASLLCGKPVCPILVKASEYSRRRGLLTGTTLTGSSPPGGLRRPVRLAQGERRAPRHP
ncbi:MAG: hypothetical protein M1144_05350 [Candidatus Thermoplasmatota archaeon]|nr:hypothetical protein [Candidatus Thermoplasmatota archaeon]